MTRNVSSVERYVRLAAGVAAAMAAWNARGWKRAALGTMAAAGFGTALTRFCPINQAVGRQAFDGDSPLEEGLRDTELRRETAMASALGSRASTDADHPRVTADSDVFGRS